MAFREHFHDRAHLAADQALGGQVRRQGDDIQEFWLSGHGEAASEEGVTTVIPSGW